MCVWKQCLSQTWAKVIESSAVEGHSPSFSQLDTISYERSNASLYLCICIAVSLFVSVYL